jgi:hypothetical protein
MVTDFAEFKKDVNEKMAEVEIQLHASAGEASTRMQDFDARCHQHYQEFVQLLEAKDIANLELNNRVTKYRNEFQELKEEEMKTAVQLASHTDKAEALAKEIIHVEKKAEAMVQGDTAAREEQFRHLDNRMALLTKQMQCLGKVVDHSMWSAEPQSVAELVNQQMEAGDQQGIEGIRTDQNSEVTSLSQSQQRVPPFPQTITGQVDSLTQLIPLSTYPVLASQPLQGARIVPAFHVPGTPVCTSRGPVPNITPIKFASGQGSRAPSLSAVSTAFSTAPSVHMCSPRTASPRRLVR